MSKVFVLLHDNGYDGYDFHGVYSTREKAEEKAEYLAKCYSYGVANMPKYFDIEEVKIDEEE